MPVKKLSDLTTLTGIIGTDSVYIVRSGTNYNTTITNIISGMNINTGTGTQNYVVKFTATGTTVGNSIIYDNGTNVGIGTTGPLGKLHVYNSAGSASVYIDSFDNNNEAIMKFIRANIDSDAMKIATNFGGSGDSATWTMNFYSNSVNTMTLKNGNVGIGTTSPGNKLHLYDSSLDVYLRIETDKTDGDAGIKIFNDATSWTTGINPNNSDAYTIARADGFGANNHLVITTGGNVGIGTTSPDNKLEIYSTGNLGTDPTAATSTLLKLSQETADVAGEVWGVGFNVNNVGTDYLGAFVEAYGNFDTNGNTSLIFGTRGTTGSATERMRISHNGNVGIGTTSPNTKLTISVAAEAAMDFAGQTTGAQYISMTNTGGASYFGIESSAGGRISTGTSAYALAFAAPSGKSVQFGDATGPTMTIKSGNVGIGTTSPGNMLTIYGTTPTLQLVDSVESTVGFFGNANDLVSGTAGLLAIRAEDGLYISGGGNAQHIFVNTSGNVGIGTTGPDHALHILSNSDTKLKVEGTGNDFIQLKRTGVGQWYIGDNSGHLTFNTSSIAGGGAKFMIQSGGNVGIGTTNPSRLLDLGGTTTPYMAFTPSATNSQWVIGSDASGFIVYDDTNNDYRAAFSKTDNAGFSIGRTYYNTAAPTDGLIVEGNVGLGTSAPSAYVHLKAGSTGASTGALKFTSGSLLSSIESGVVEFDGNTYYVSTSMRHALAGTIYASTASAGPSATNVETSLIGTAPSWCTVTLPANYLVAGKTFLLRAAGTFTTSVGGGTQYIIKFKLTSTNSNYILSSSTFTPSGSLTGMSWNLDLIFTLRATGAYSTPATISPRVILEYRDSTVSATSLLHAPMVTASGSVYTDQAITIDLTATMGGTYTSADWTCTNFAVIMLD